MATVYERKSLKGISTYRVTLRRRGCETFNLTFDDWKAACEWVEEHEESFFKDPQKYFEWKEVHHNAMRRERRTVRSNILRSRLVKDCKKYNRMKLLP